MASAEQKLRVYIAAASKALRSLATMGSADKQLLSSSRLQCANDQEQLSSYSLTVEALFDSRLLDKRVAEASRTSQVQQSTSMSAAIHNISMRLGDPSDSSMTRDMCLL